MATDPESGVTRFTAMRHQLAVHRLKASLYHFMQEGWHVVEPGQPFMGNWHIDRICSTLEHVEDGDIDRLIINQPPGTSKTRTLLFFVAWCIARNPRIRIMLVTYGDKLSTKFASDIRQLLRSTWFQAHFPVKFKADQDEKAYFATLEGGWCLATSVGGQGQGLHPDVIVLDDPLKAGEAMTLAGRDWVWDWYKNTLATRGMTRKVRLLASGQRLNIDDFFGRLLSSPAADAWFQIRFPMRFEKSRPPSDVEPEGYQSDPQDPRTEEGELLWPGVLDEKTVKFKELELAEDAPAQFQQNPKVLSGRIFKIDQFKFYDELPAMMQWCRGWDTAATEGGGDFSCGFRLGAEVEESVINGRRIVKRTGRYFAARHQVHEQVGPENLDALMKSTAEMDGRETMQREEREGGSSGKTVITGRTKLLAGFDYDEVRKSTNKVVNSKPYRAQVNAGNVLLPRGAEWLRDYLKELAEFPGGVHDDWVDGSATAFNSLIDEEPKPKVKITFGH